MRKINPQSEQLIVSIVNDPDLSNMVPDAAVLEKDLLVTEAILAVTEAMDSIDDVEVVFCGGTCLSKAHGVINRMSEDVDMKYRH